MAKKKKPQPSLSSTDTRRALIRKLEAERHTRVICYVTSIRENMESWMAMDAVRKVYEHLTDIRKPADIDLFIVSNGGDGIVPWRLVTLIREQARRFSVLVPYRAFSAATLTALGADSIVMHPMGMLGPTDPTVANDFNPKDSAGNRLGISVEDVTAYLALVTEDAGITHEDELIHAFIKLADSVHPLALGNVKRSLSQSRMMAKKLLGLHMDAAKDSHKIDEIVDNLTSKLFYHGHAINRVEARRDINLGTVENASPVIEDLMWRLYREYECEMLGDERFDAAMEFVRAFPNMQPGDTNVTDEVEAKLAYIESRRKTDVASVTYRLSGTMQPNKATQITTIFSRRGWIRQ